MSNPVIVCDKISKRYHDGSTAVDVLTDITFSVEAGELVAIAGSSGSGKSTLLHLLGGLDQPTSGAVRVASQNILALSESARSRWRNLHLGFVYQFHHLLPEFSALENVGLPLLIRGESPRKIFSKARDLLSAVGLLNRIKHRPSELSGGERQRVAIARALITEPACILADEPTGNLDPRNASNVLELFVNLQKNHGTAVVLVTHDLVIAKQAERILQLENGTLKHYA